MSDPEYLIIGRDREGGAMRAACSALFANMDDTIDELHQVRAIGVQVSLDDFGTGYSSLAHLRVFPFDKIKIDGSFVRDAANRADCAAIVKAIADLGRFLGVTIVAEGVETQTHLDLVRTQGCHEAQGYVCGRPEPTGEAAEAVTALEAKARR